MKHYMNGLIVNVGDRQIVPYVKVRNLGVIFDLTFDDHISAICQSVHFHIRSIGKVQKFLSFDVSKILIHALINSRLDYCHSILHNLPDTKIGRLQRVQNQAARILTRSGFLIRRSSAIRRFIAGFLKCDSRTIMKSFLKKNRSQILRKFRGMFMQISCQFASDKPINLRIAELRLMRNPPLITSQRTHHTCIKTTTLAKSAGKNQIQNPDPDPQNISCQCTTVLMLVGCKKF